MSILTALLGVSAISDKYLGIFSCFEMNCTHRAFDYHN